MEPCVNCGLVAARSGLVAAARVCQAATRWLLYCSLHLSYRILGLVCVFICEEPSRKAMALRLLVIASFVYNIVFLVKNMFTGFYVESRLKKAMALQIASSCM